MSDTDVNNIDNNKLHINLDMNLEEPAVIIKEAGEHQNDVVWSPRDLEKLLDKLENILPDNDKMLYCKRVERIPWDEIAFENYTGNDCKQLWLLMQKRLRHFRVLKELVIDAKNLQKVADVSFCKSTKTINTPRPRKPLTAYMLYFMEYKDQVHKDNPGAKMSTVSKKVAEMYRNLKPTEKEVYLKMAADAKAQYDKDVLNCTEQYSELKIVSKPKKLKTPFEFYYEDALQNFIPNKDINRRIFRDKCRREWRESLDEEKIKWINIAESESQKETTTPSKSVLSKKEKLIKDKYDGKPMKPPNSAYHLFLRTMLQSEALRDISPKERMNYIASLWKDIPEEKKDEYHEKLQQMISKYKAAYPLYLEQLSTEKQREELQNNIRKRKFKTEIKSDSDSEQSQRSDCEAEMSCKTKRSNHTNTMTDDEKQIKQKLVSQQPKQPPLTTLGYFKQKYDGNGSYKNAWMKLSSREKKKYADELDEIKKSYIAEFESFLRKLSKEELIIYSK